MSHYTVVPTWLFSIAWGLIAGSTLAIADEKSEFRPSQHREMETLFSRTKPQCIGRYLIDVPESFNNQLKNMVFIDDFKIESKPQFRPAFEQRINRREAELIASFNIPGNKPETAPYLKEIIRLPNGKGVIFDHNEPGTPDIYRQLEAYVYIDSITFLMTTDIRDFSAPRHKEKKRQYLERGFTESDANNKPAKLAALQSLISRLSGRMDDNIPTEKGVCIPNGFIRDDGRKHAEKVSFSYENTDFIFALDMDNTIKGSNDTLLNRSPSIDEAIKNAHYRTIKKGDTHRNSIHTQEWLVSGMQESNSIKGSFPLFDFTLYANEANAGIDSPLLSIAFNNRDKPTQYNKAELVYIWDRLTRTLRYH